MPINPGPGGATITDSLASGSATSCTYPYPSSYPSTWTPPAYIPTYVPPLPEKFRLALEVLATKNIPAALRNKAAAVLVKGLTG